MLLNEIFGLRVGPGWSRKLRQLRKGMDMVPELAQAAGNEDLVTMTDMAREYGEDLADQLRDLRVKYNQAIAAGDYDKAIGRYRKAQDLLIAKRLERKGI